MATRKRRIRSPHPGVVLIPPKGRYTSWRARFDDPDTGRPQWLRLNPVDLRTAEARREWAIRKSKSLAKRDMEIESGAPRATGTALTKAVDRYFEAHPHLSEETRGDYRAAADGFLEWADKNGVESADDLTRAKLLAFRESLIQRPKHAAKTGGRRGARNATERRRSPVSINSDLRRVGAVLRYLRQLDLLLRVSSDDLSDGLKPVRRHLDAPEFFRPTDLRQLLDAALAHDAATFCATRGEHRSEGVRGTTNRYEPIAPFVAVVLLAGFRLGEALGLRWAAVDLSVTDAEGRPKGEVRLKAAETKTRHGRSVSLGVTPLLRELLEVLREAGESNAYVFGGAAPMTKAAAEAARKRLVGKVLRPASVAKKDRPRKQIAPRAPETFNAPSNFTWQLLRSTCATYQTNAPSLFGDAAAWSSAKRLGHSVTVAEARYAGQLEVSREARTLEAAMGIEEHMRRIISAARARLVAQTPDNVVSIERARAGAL